MKTKKETVDGKKCAVCGHVHKEANGTCSCGCKVGEIDSVEA